MIILHVEDNSLDADLVHAAMERYGGNFELRQAASAAEARKMLRESGPPDILLTDLALPDGNGLDLLREVRDQGLSTAVVVLTGSGDEQQVAKVLRAGADDYVVKGSDCLNSLPSVLEAAHLRFQSHENATPRTLRVLYAEHNETDLDLTCRHFERHAPHIRLQCVQSSREVLDILPETSDWVCPWELVLLDYRLAGMNGLEVLEEICQNRKLNIPVIIITGQGDENVASRALRLGAGDYLVKTPGYLNTLPEAITETYSRHQLRREQMVLRSSTRRFRRLTERLGHYLASSPTVTYALHINEQKVVPIWVSDNLPRILGHQVDQALAPGWWNDQVHPEDIATAQTVVATLIEQGDGNAVHEYRLRHSDGHYRWIRDDLRLRKDDDGRAVEIVGTWTDITESRAAEAAMRAEQDFSETLIASLPVLFFLFDSEGQMLRWNRQLELQLGLSPEEVKSRKALDFVVHEDRETVGNVIAEVLVNGRAEVEARLRTADGGSRHYLFSSRRFMVAERPCVLGIGVDTTEKRRLEAQFLRAQRLESVGRLAGGIAHDLNNLLAPMLMAPQIVRMKIKDPEVQGLMSTIESNARRGAEIIRQLLTFGRAVEGRREPVQVLKLVREIERIMNATFPKNIRIQTPPDDAAPWPVMADPTQIHQVLMNLCVNARDAMAGGGVIEITLTNANLDSTFAAMTPGARPGKHVMLTVRDTGSGISSEHLDHIFDPFFTTKELGQGTGLGLSTVLGIIKGHEGFIQVQSQPGKGTTMAVYLPVTTQQPQTQAETPEPGMPPSGHGEMVLVVDDEASFRKVICGLLEKGGYRVLEAEDGATALSLCAAHGANLKALVVDYMMPIMDGHLFLHAASRLGLNVGVILVSGHALDEKARQKMRPLVDVFLSKPFSAEDLLSSLSAVLLRAASRPQEA